MPKGYIYILTNPSFPDYVKIGYSDDVDRRLKDLNRTECTPFAFRVYATYEVESRLGDKRVHDIIDRLNPGLRSIDYVDGIERKREFYAMTAADAYSILQAMAEIHGREDKLVLKDPTAKERQEEEVARTISEEKRERRANFTFDMVGIEPGETVVFTCRGNEHNGTPCVVVDDRRVRWGGREWRLSALAREFTGQESVQGSMYFKYEGRWLNDLRDEAEGRSSGSRRSDGSSEWVTPCDPKYYDIERAFAELEAVEWRQTTNVMPGDTVYIYVSAPAQALRYKCIVEETDLFGPSEIDDSRFYLKGKPEESQRHMRLRLVEDYGTKRYPLSLLKKHGLTTIQSPRHLPFEIEELEHT